MTGGSPDARFEKFTAALVELQTAISEGDQGAINRALATVRDLRDTGRAPADLEDLRGQIRGLIGDSGREAQN